MSSAAKLRKYGRGTATIAAAALVMTSFGPAAFAWDATPAPTNANTAGAASIGMVDADTNAVDTQGAQLVQAGVSDQLAGEMRFVVPNTWKTGDYIDFELQTSVADPATSADYVQWASLPQVNIDKTPYAGSTHVADDSGTTKAAGSTEDHLEAKWTNTVPGSTDAPVAPTYKVEPVGSSPFRTFRVTFTNDSSDVPVTQTAKFIGTVNTPKITVGKNVDGAIKVKAIPGGATATNLKFVDDGGDPADTTAIGAVSVARLDVQNGAVVADNTSQPVGPIVLAPAQGAFTASGETVVITLTNGTFDTDAAVTPTYTWYDANGAAIGTAGAKATAAAATITTSTPPSGAVKLVVSGAYAKSLTQTMTYSAAGGADGMTLAPLAGFIGSVHQGDIKAPGGGTTAEVVNLLENPTDRLNGANRYETAAAAARRLAPTYRDANGNVANVVIVSGQSYADALSASYLAAVKNAPILLTTKDELAPATVQFMRDYGVKNAYIIGDTAVVGASVESALANMAATNKTGLGVDAVATQNKVMVTRLGGKNRFVTNRLANQFAVSSSTNGVVGSTYTTFGQSNKRTAIFVSGLTPWDALSGGTLVGNDGVVNTDPMPIILSYGNEPAGEAASQLNSMGVTRTLVIGGTGVVPDSVTKVLQDHGVDTVRLAGANRFATNRAVLDFAMKAAPTASKPSGGFGWISLGSNSTQPILANSGQPSATGWVDALSVAPVAAAEHLPILLTPADKLADATKAALQAYASPLGATSVISGGYAAVSAAVQSAADAIIAP